MQGQRIFVPYFCPKFWPPGRWQSRAGRWVWESFTIPAFLVLCTEDQFVDCGKPAWRFSLVPSNQAKKLARKHEGSHPGNTSLPFPKPPVCLRAKSLKSCPTLCDPLDCSSPDSSVHRILQARILEWVAIPSSRGSSWPRDRTYVSYVSCTGRRVLYH